MNIPQVGSLSLGNQGIGSAKTENASPPTRELALGAGAPLARASAPPPAAAPPSLEPAHQADSVQQVAQAVQQLNQAMQTSNSSLNFSIDKATKQAVVTVTDSDTGEVVMQIPSKETLALARYLTEMNQLKLLSQKA
jgi:flagellar protein FlaG